MITYICYFIHVYYCEVADSMQYHPPNANQEVSNTRHFGCVSDSLGRLMAMSQCMASILNIDTCNTDVNKRAYTLEAALTRVAASDLVRPDVWG